jgi:hypothetical protein
MPQWLTIADHALGLAGELIASGAAWSVAVVETTPELAPSVRADALRPGERLVWRG